MIPMRVRLGIDWKIGLWGCTAGLCVGLLMILGASLATSANRGAVFHPSGPPAAREIGQSGGAGGVLTLAPDEAGLGMPDEVSTRGRVRLFLVAAHMANGDVEKAVDVAGEMDAGVDRDCALEEIAEKIVPREMTTNRGMLPTNNDEERGAVSARLRRVVDLAAKATSSALRARLLVRAAIVKRILDKGGPAPTSLQSNDLDPETLLKRVAILARTVPPDSKAAGAGKSVAFLFGALLGTLGIIGFVVGQLVQPVLQAIGSVVAYEVSRSVHPAISGRLKGIHDDVTGADYHPATAQHVEGLPSAPVISVENRDWSLP
jgi:hypothetical protein